MREKERVMKNIKKLFRILVGPLLLWEILTYSLLSFLTWDVNIAHWGWFPRFILLIVALFVIILMEANEHNRNSSIFGGKSIQREIEMGAQNISKLFEEKVNGKT